MAIPVAAPAAGVWRAAGRCRHPLTDAIPLGHLVTPVPAAYPAAMSIALHETLEVRWFLPDGHPCLARAQEWFVSAKRDRNRTDDYLLTGRDDLGIKARVAEDGSLRVETKYLAGSLGAMQVAAGAVGKLERWMKLSLPVGDPKPKKEGSWRSVEKERRLRTFEFQQGVVAEVPIDAQLRPEAGCGVELTRLRYRLDAASELSVAWTLGFEAFGREVALLQVLLATCSAALAEHLRLELDASCSMGYPAWLLTTARDRRR